MATLRKMSNLFLSKSIKSNFHKKLNVQLNNNCTCNRMSTYSAIVYDGKVDPASFFFRKDVQSLLKTLTRVDLNKVFRKRKTGDKKLEEPVYKFMTDEELQQALAEAKSKADEMLQMPPVVKIRKDSNRILSKDPALKGLDTARFVFTDISFGVHDSERTVVVREPNGTLKEAEWNLKDKMNQLYFPKPHRQLKLPKMFEGSYFEDLLNRKEYEFILDRACVQFEPNDPEYQRVVTITYQHLNENNEFELLRSTRHFGNLTFFLVWNKNIDNLVLDLIETAHVGEVKQLLTLYGLIHSVKFEGTNEIDVIKEYIKKYANKKGALELALQAYQELVKQNEGLDRGIKAAHGIS